MDSLTQMALGAAVGTAVMGRRAGPRAALWGAVCGTLPDLDTFVAYGDPVRDFTFHRAESHALFWLTLASPPLALLIYRLHGAVAGHFTGWLALVWGVLITHALLDAFTVYGTQLLLPFSDYPVGIGSIFIIDPLYTLPLLLGVAAALALRRRDPARAQRLNSVGLVLSTTYLAWSVAAQTHVEGVVHRELGATPLAAGRVLVTPTPFNTLLWRIVVMDETGYHEGLYSLLDGPHGPRLTRHASQPALLEGLRDDWNVQRLAWFSKGFYGVSKHGTRVVMVDLRMGQTPWFVFSFVVGAHDGQRTAPVPARQLPTARPPLDSLGWLWRRIIEPELVVPPGQGASAPRWRETQ